MRANVTAPTLSSNHRPLYCRPSKSMTFGSAQRGMPRDRISRRPRSPTHTGCLERARIGDGQSFHRLAHLMSLTVRMSAMARAI